MHIKSVFRAIAIIFVKSMVLSLIIIFIVFLVHIVYLLGYVRGMETGIKSMENYVANVLENSQEKQVTASSTLEEVLPTPQKKTTSYLRNVSWGGPELWEAVNERRVEFGVNPLNTRSELCTIASIRLNELLELGKLDGHEGFSNLAERRPDLKWIFDKYGTLAEFLAVGGETPTETVSLWENTLGHKKLLNGGEFVWGCIYSQNSLAVAIAAY